jgi:hypothetical protein
MAFEMTLTQAYTVDTPRAATGVTLTPAELIPPRRASISHSSGLDKLAWTSGVLFDLKSFLNMPILYTNTFFGSFGSFILIKG